MFDETSGEGFAPVDWVLVNLGTNDFGDDNPPEQPFVDTFAAFLGELRVHFPSAPIVLVSGPMMSDWYPPGMNARSTLRHYLEQVVTRRADAGDANVHFVELEPQDDNGPIGCDYHPHVTTHESMAAIMEAELARIAGN